MDSDGVGRRLSLPSSRRRADHGCQSRIGAHLRRKNSIHRNSHFVRNIGRAQYMLTDANPLTHRPEPGRARVPGVEYSQRGGGGGSGVSVRTILSNGIWRARKSPSCASPPAFPGAVKQVAPFGHDLKSRADLCRGRDPRGRRRQWRPDPINETITSKPA